MSSRFSPVCLHILKRWRLKAWEIIHCSKFQQSPALDCSRASRTCHSPTITATSFVLPAWQQGEFVNRYLLGCLSTPFIRRTARGYFVFLSLGENFGNSYHPSSLLICFNVHKIYNTLKPTGSPFNHRLLAARVTQSLSPSVQCDKTQIYSVMQTRHWGSLMRTSPTHMLLIYHILYNVLSGISKYKYWWCLLHSISNLRNVT